MEKQLVTCPGCGMQIVTDNHALDHEFNASAACRELCYQLSYYTLSLRDPYFMHQLLVDTYAAQHAGKTVKPIAITFALIGLYLVNEKDSTGKQVQLVHVRLAAANTSKIWPKFLLPEQQATMTIKDVIDRPDAQKQTMIKQWSRSVWEIWKEQEQQIAALLEKYRVLL